MSALHITFILTANQFAVIPDESIKLNKAILEVKFQCAPMV